MRFLQFFAANIRSARTRGGPVARAADEFLAWCADAGVASIGTQPGDDHPGAARGRSAAHSAEEITCSRCTS
jgi:hypothetical protein